MGDNPYYGDYKVVRSPYAEDDKTLGDYGAMHMKMYAATKDLSGYDKAAVMAYFHDSYFIGDEIRDKSNRPFVYSFPRDNQYPYPQYQYLRRVLDLCFQSDICQKLGMSVNDFMHLDQATFEYIQQVYTEYKPKEDAAIKELMQKQDLKIQRRH